MSKARAPKRKEASYMSPSEIEEIRGEILEKGRLLKTAIGKKFPDAEKVTDAMAQLLGVVEGYKLVGEWVSSVTTKEIRDVSLIVCNHCVSLVISMSNYRVSQITLAAVIECVQKSYTCFETNPDLWTSLNYDGLKLLVEKDLEQYQENFLDEEDIQEEWSAVIRQPGKHVNLLVGQKTDEDLREETDEENYYDPEYWATIQQNYFLAYHQAKAHARWCATRPDEAAHYRRFQVRIYV